ncbi:MAG: Eco57I restriction-modification methylase domain-containing protein [Cyanobacteria bacterium RUI128]|nr:Eco57I restriction-modification methylase domain-containing protein [Cyanobacteria bacterium RUI128]
MGLYDDIKLEVEGQESNTPTSSGVGLFDDIKAEVENAPQEPSFMDNIRGFGGKFKNAIPNMGTSNPYEDALQTLKGGIETNVFQPNQYGVTPLQGVGNIAHDIGSGVNKFVHAPLEFAKQLGRDTVETGKNIVHNPALLKDVPSAIMTGLKDLPFDVAQAVVDLPETIASSYNNRPFERQVNVPNSDEFAENMATNLLNIFLNEEQKRRNQELHQQRLQQIAQEREKLNQLPIAQTVGAFMLPASNIAKVAKTKGIADSIKTGAKWGLATTPGSVEDRTVGTLGGGAFGGTLHAGIKTAPKIAKGVKNVSAEIVDRINPENYEQVINSKPVKKGTGLSQRTVYEPEVRYEYKPKRNTYNMKDALGKERISGTRTDFTMGESGELKTPVRPSKKKYGVSTNVQYTPNFTIERVAPSVFAKQQAKAEAKEEARQEKMEELAPNTMAEQKVKEELKEAQKQTEKRGHHTKDFNKGDIIRDIYRGNVYEVIDPDKRGIGHLRDVDTNEIFTINADNNAHFEKYEHNTDDLIEVEEFKYDEKEKSRNQINYMYSKQEVVDAYNEYVKNPTEANREKYENISGQALKEFHDNEEAIKNGTFNQRVENTEKGNTKEVMDTSGNTETEIDRVAKEYATMLGHNEVSDFHKKYAKALVNKDAEFIKDLIGHGKGFNDNSKKMFAKYTGIELPTTIKGKKEVVDKWANGESLDAYKKQTFDNDKPTMKFSYNSKNKGDLYYNKIYLLTDKDGNITHFTDGRAVYRSDYVNADYSKHPESNVIKTDSNMQVQKVIEDYLKKTEDSEYLLTDVGKEFKKDKITGRVFELDNDGEKLTVYVDKKYLLDGKGIELFTSSKENPFTPLKITKNGEYIGLIMPMDVKNPDIKDVKPFLKKDTKKQAKPLEKSEKIVNNEDIEPTNGGKEDVRPNGIQERSEKQRQTEARTDERGERTSGNDVSVRRENDSRVLSERGITKEHQARIQKNFKNQHESNQDIEDFINNKEYEVYNGNLPDEIKAYLKRYAGAGGLEKQGAEGKGLLSEYYTPDNIVKKMWELTSQYIKADGSKVLEPSVGIGRFLEHAPKGTSFDVVEMNPVSAKITELLYPEANVRVGQFQERFIDNNKNVPIKDVKPEYDIIIGNPPYGEYSGRFKGLGEGKKYKTLQAYFINRGLDTLKENGVMTFIVPSSFLDNISDKMEISNKAEILDAYRLPENTFDTTSIGTDIIVMRKRTGQGQDLNFISKEWFKKHPEKILGTVETRKNKYGKEEIFVKGDKNAVDNIDTSKKDIKETETVIEEHPKAPKKQQATRKSAKKTAENTVKGKVEYNEYKHKNPVSEEDLPYYTDTQVDGTLPKDKYSPNEKVNQYNGELYNDINYLQGDIYEKLDALKNEDISEKQKEIQRKKLEKVLPTPKTVSDISFNPTSDFIREYKTNIVKDVEEWGWYDGRWGSKKVSKEQTLDKLYKDYLDNLSAQERDNVPVYRMKEFVDGKEIRLDYKYSKYTLSEAEKKKERLAQRGRELAKIKKAVDKTFNDFVKNELSAEQQKKLAEAWNRNFNYSYTPDYKQMPMLVKGLKDTFYDKKLNLYDVQVEGINFLTNKGVGLLGFEVGVGKTLSGIISTVQNMQMGRCKRPLILVPNQVKDNWIKEINETFPNIKVNDVGNMSKFNGEIGDNTLTVATYEALGNIWYDEGVANRLINDLYQTGQNLNRESTKRGQETVKERAEKMLGNAEKGNKKLHLLEDLGFDHITVDEAHNFKNLFGQAQADGKDGNTYVNITGGAESARASRLFLLTQQILKNNGNRNVFMLTATPFNNSPLEVFNMLSFIAKDKLDKMGLYNVYQFMENYAEITSDWVVDSKNEVVEKQIVTGFKNAQSLREVIKSAMMIRSAEDAGIKRPEKYTKRVVLEPSQKQLELIAEAEEEALKGGKNDGAVLKALTKSKLATLSPDIATNNIDVSPEDFIKNSPKLDYCCEAIANLHKSDSKASQILYIPQGVDYLPKIVDYLVNKGVFKKNEIAIIKGGIKDDKLDSITSSFNDPDGDIKLIIGTGKIKEGMNLNKNSATLYVPYLDWNPTDFVQVVGRIWRQGNAYKKVRVVVPLLKNSSDSFMFQKLSEKTDRINNVMDGDKDYIDTNELNTAEEKLNMISDPQKKARMFTRVEKQKLEAEKSALEGRLDTVRTYQNNLNNIKRDIESNKRHVNEYQDMLKGLDKENSSYERYSNNVKYYKKELKEAEAKLTRIEKRISQLELDFEGKDAPEAIEELIKAKQQEIEDVEKLAEKKLIEYQKDYEKERATSKTIDDHIKDFENDTKELYGDNQEGSSAEIPWFMDVAPTTSGSRDLNLETINRFIARGTTIEELSTILPDELRQKIDSLKSYKVVDMPNASENEHGLHVGRIETIKINLNAVGNNPHKFVETFMHEVEHAIQLRYYKELLRKQGRGETLTKDELDYMRAFRKSDRLNRVIQKFRKSPNTKKVIKKFRKITKGMSSEARSNYIANMKNLKERDIILKDIKYFDKYWNLFKEVGARNIGEFYAKDFKNESRSIPRSNKSLVGVIRQRNMGTLGRLFSRGRGRGQDEYGDASEEISIEQSETKGAQTRQDEAKIEKATRDSLYKWYGEVEKARYDVDKDLNHFNKITKATAKDFSNKTGLKVSDKMVREILPFLRERTEVPEALGRKDLTEFYNKLSQADITRLTKLADDVCAKFDKYWQNYKDAKGIISDEDIENHISHLWNVGKKQKGILTNYFNTNSRFAKPRTIETLVKGIEQGFEPRTLDIGEILKIQSDSLIKSANDSILAETLKKMRFNKEILIQPSGKAPADWVEIDHPALNKAVYSGSTDNGIILSRRSVKVHPAVAEIIAPVFEVQKADNLGWKIYDNVNGTLKQIQLGFSGFHGYALTESAIGNSYLKDTLKHLNPKKFVDAIKNGNYDIFKQEKVAKDGIEHGLRLGTPSDLNRSNVEKFLSNIPFIGKLTEVNNKILWDCLHNSFKIEAYKIKCEEVGKDITDEQKRSIAQWVNDSFGGQAWELLGVKNSTVKGMSRLLLSPDWLISTTRQFMGMAENVPMSKWLENSNIKGLRKFAKLSGVSDVGDTVGVRGKSARRFWATAMVFSVLFYNLINAMFRAKDRKEHPEYYSDNSLMSYTIWDNALPADKASTKIMPYIFIGRNKDGSARYLRLGKQFREVPEMISEPVSKLSMKSATVPSALANVGLGYSIGDIPKKLAGKDNEVYYNQEIWNGYGKFAKKKQGSDLAKGRVKTAVKSVAPFIVNNATNDKHNMSAWDMFAQTSNGMGYTKAKNQYLYAYEHGNNTKDIAKITQRGIQDGMSYRKLKSAQNKAKDEYTQNLINEYSSQYVNALKEQNQTKINKVADKLEKDNVPANIRVKVYKSALKEYRKSVK